MTITIATNNAGILYSPYNWLVTSGSAKTINGGAYFRTLFTGTACTLTFDLSNMVTPASQIEYRIDGYGPWISAVVASTVTLTVPTDTAGYQAHYLEVVVKSTTLIQNRWLSSGTSVMLVLTGIVLDNGSSLIAPQSYNKNILFYGDSITEGFKTVNSTATNDTDTSDSGQGWAFNLGKSLNANFGVVGFSGSGLIATGNGNVPVLSSTYNLLWQGQSRTFSPIPDLIIINEGTNDGGNDITTQAKTLLNLLFTACPGSKIVVLLTFKGTHGSEWQNAIATSNMPNLVTYIDTTGFFNSAYSSDALHPFGFTNIATIAPKIGNLVAPILNGSASSKSFRKMFSR